MDLHTETLPPWLHSPAAGLVLEPLPVSAWSLVCVTVLLLTKACTFEAVMGGLKNEAIWLSE
jgi:hypothetical protein